MNVRVGKVLRVITGLLLLSLSLGVLLDPGPARWLAGAEVIAAAVFCQPRAWRLGGVILLVILGVAFSHHAMAGQFATSLLFAALVVGMALAYERP
jgi:hypothetical protein